MFSKTIHRISLQIAGYGLFLFMIEVAIFFRFYDLFSAHIGLTILFKIVVIFAIVYVTSRLVIHANLKPIQEMQQRLESFNLHASHELKTPLANISGSIDLGIKTGEANYMRDAKKQVLDMSKEIDNLLALTHIHSGNLKPEKIHPAQIVQKIVDVFKKNEGKNHNFILSLDKKYSLECDTGLFRHVVRNLISNAIKYSPPRSNISITIKPKYLSIQDDGEGMSEDFQKRAFELYTQKDATRKKGQGIGLSLVKKICDAHGWTIHIKSSEGNGTDFRIVW